MDGIKGAILRPSKLSYNSPAKVKNRRNSGVRVCKRESCAVALSVYNPHPTCFVHTKKKYRLRGPNNNAN